MNVNWEMVRADAFTVIRAEFPVVLVQQLAAEDDNYTPVSGDALARRKADLVKLGR